MTYNLQEQIEKAFKAGAKYLIDSIEYDDYDQISYAMDTEITKAAERYIDKEALA